MKFIDWAPLATGAATMTSAVVAAVVVHFTTRRTTLTTWRSKTAEWQHKALTDFYDPALYFRRFKDAPHPAKGASAELDSAWSRLEPTGPEHLAEHARPLYEAARELAVNGNALRAWGDLAEYVRQQHSHATDQLNRDPTASPGSVR